MQAAQNLSTTDDTTVDPYHPDCAAAVIREFGTAEALRIAARVLMLAADGGPYDKGLLPTLAFATHICIHTIGDSPPVVVH